MSGGETFDQYGPRITLGRPLTAKLSSSLAYQFYWRGSDLPGRDYTVQYSELEFQLQVLGPRRKNSGIYSANCYKD